MSFNKIVAFFILSIFFSSHFLSSLSAQEASYKVYMQGEPVSSISFQVCPDETHEATLTIYARDENTEDCRFDLSWKESWLELYPASFALAPGGSKEVAVTIKTVGLTPGQYSDTIMMQSNCDPVRSEISVTLEVTAPVFNVNPLKTDWEIPYQGEVRKEITLTNSFCKNTIEMELSIEQHRDLDIFMSTQPIVMGAREFKTIPITFRSNGFYPESYRRLTITFTSPLMKPVTAEYRLVRETEIPIVKPHNLSEAWELWEGEKVILRGFLHRGSTPVFTSDPFALLAMNADYDTPQVRVADPFELLQWNPWEQAPVVYADLKGILGPGTFERPAELTLKERPRLYYPVLYPWPRPPEETLPQRRPIGSSSDYLAIIGSTGHPVPEWMERNLLMKWEAGMFFNSSDAHLKIFYGEGSLPSGRLDPPSIAQRKELMKPYMMKGQEDELLGWLASLEAQMREHLRNDKTPSLTLRISGYSQKRGDEMLFHLGPDQTLGVETLAKALEKISILGSVHIELNTSYAGAWTERLLKIGNVKIITSSEADQENYFHQHDISTQISRWLKSGKAGRSLGAIEWLDLLEKVENPLGGEGVLWEETIQCEYLGYRKSYLKEGYVWMTFQVDHIQEYWEKHRHNSADSSHSYQIDLLRPQEELGRNPEVNPPSCQPDRPSFEPFQATQTAGKEPPLMELEGKVERLNPEQESFEMHDPFFEGFREIVVPERPIPVSEGDRVRVVGTEQGDRRIIPIAIEVLEKACGLMIKGPEDLVFCPGTLPRDNSSGYRMSSKELEWKLSNAGKIDIGVSWSLQAEPVGDDQGIKLDLGWIVPDEPWDSFAPGENMTITGEIKFSHVPDILEKEVRFRVVSRFFASPSPPCKAYEEWIFEVVFCSTERNIEGRVSFLNAEDKECPLPGMPVRMYLKHEPQHGHDTRFNQHQGNIPDLHESAGEDLPHVKYYLETLTDRQGRYAFSFHDFGCDHQYRILVSFETAEVRMSYHEGDEVFFAYGDIESPMMPCKPANYERNLRLDMDRDLVYPSNFEGDPGAVAQSWCHMQECFSIFRSESCGDQPMIPEDYLPVKVVIFSNTEGTWYDSSHRKINISIEDSRIHSPNRPMNREWHEFGHFLHDALSSGLPEMGDEDANHGGFSNSCSSDSLTEGIAILTSLVILRQLKMRDNCCGSYREWNNGVYRMDGAHINLEEYRIEANSASYWYLDRSKRPPVYRHIGIEELEVRNGYLVTKDGYHQAYILDSFESLAVAGLLLDLVDDYRWYEDIRSEGYFEGRDDDGFSLSRWQDLYCIIQGLPLENQNMKGLYEALMEKYHKQPRKQKKIQDIFVQKGFFMDRNFNGTREAGETIGQTYRPAVGALERANGSIRLRGTPQPRPELPGRNASYMVEGLGVKINLYDAGGSSMPRALIRIWVMAESSKNNPIYSYTRWVENGGFVYLFTLPGSKDRFRIELANYKGKVAIISEQELWDSVAKGNEYARSYDIVAGRPMEPGEWIFDEIFDDASIELLSLPQGTRRKDFTMIGYHTGYPSEELSVTFSEPWINVFPTRFVDPACRLTLHIDASEVSVGMHRVEMQFHGLTDLVHSFSFQVEVSPASTVIQLQIGNQQAWVEGKEVVLDASPYILPPGRTMVPLRFISEGFGASIDFEPKQGLVTDIWVLYQSTDIHLTIGAEQAIINNEAVPMDAPAEIVAGRTFVPIRLVAESFGAEVAWDASTETITITLKHLYDTKGTVPNVSNG